MVTPPKKAPTKAADPKKPKDDDDDIEEIEPDQVSDDEDEKSEPIPVDDPDAEKPAVTGDLKSAAKRAQEAVATDRARDVPLLETYKAASLQKQADWENDAKELFHEEERDVVKRRELLAALDANDIKQRKEQEALRRDSIEKQVAEDKRIMTERAKELRDEADRLDKAAKDHKPEKHTAAHAA